MRQRELRIALVCYGGISLAVYMHGVTKELWKALKASRAAHSATGEVLGGTEAVYARLLDLLRHEHDLDLRVLCDIVAGASAGGINSVFLAQAIHSGQSLEPLTDLWLDGADVDVLLDPDARPWSKAAKFWMKPAITFLLKQPGNAVSESVAPETRREVREKLSRLVRSRWFEPPFGGLGFSRLLYDALEAMREAPGEAPLLPPRHPIDLFVTATDFKGHLETLRLHSPPLVLESEHRVSIGFRAETPVEGGAPLASPFDMVFAARASASFPGAFPALRVAEIDTLALQAGKRWESRKAFLSRILPQHDARETLDHVSLIDGSVLVNAPFADAISVLQDRPASRPVDRRFVYIDPRPDRVGADRRDDPKPPGFFSVIFGSLSSIPREQPIRDNLEAIEEQSREASTLHEILRAVRPEVEEAVERLFGRTLFLDKPSERRLRNWRKKAQDAAAAQAGYAYHGYAQAKFAGIVEMLAETIHEGAPEAALASPDVIAKTLYRHLADSGLRHLAGASGRATPEAISFFRAHDLAFRRRRLRLLARRLTQEWEGDPGADAGDREAAQESIYSALAVYRECSKLETLGTDFPEIAARVLDAPGEVLAHIAERRGLAATDLLVDGLIASALGRMPEDLRRPLMLAYLGFPFFDTVTLPLLRERGLNEFDPVKVDRISPEDARSIRQGGAPDTLRGTEFFNFGAFFSRTYRENDYLWGRLHGAERMIDLIASTIPEESEIAEVLSSFKRDAFHAILDEEAKRLKADPHLIERIKAEICEKMG